MNGRQRKRRKDGGALIMGKERYENVPRGLKLMGWFLQCAEHPWYKGLRRNPRDCPACDFIHDNAIHT